MSRYPEFRRVGAYAIIVRDDHILLSRLASHVTRDELWTLPGGGLDHGEDPAEGVVREVLEETGLAAEIDPRARVYSGHYPSMRRDGRNWNYHALRIVYDGWVPPGSPQPRVQEIDGSTVEARWVPLADVGDGSLPIVPWVAEALADHRPYQRQRAAAYALIRHGEDILLTRLSQRAAFPGRWTLPGGGIEHGEPPAKSLSREIAEECGIACEVGRLLDVHDSHYQGTAPTGRFEDFHGVHLIFEARVAEQARLHVAETDGTCDEVAWVAITDVTSGRVPVLDVVEHALEVG